MSGASRPKRGNANRAARSSQNAVLLRRATIVASSTFVAPAKISGTSHATCSLKPLTKRLVVKRRLMEGQRQLAAHKFRGAVGRPGSLALAYSPQSPDRSADRLRVVAALNGTTGKAAERPHRRDGDCA